MGVISRMITGWNAFRQGASPPVDDPPYSSGVSFTASSPSTQRRRYSSERSMIASIYTRLAIDLSGVIFSHVQLDEQNRYKQDMESGLNDCLHVQPNIDQGPRALRQDIALTLFDKAAAVLVPVDTTRDQQTGEIVDILSLRVGEVITWFPNHVKVSVYNEDTGKRQEITLEKKFVAIIENPLNLVMNEPNSTLQRLIRKLNLLDGVDEQTSSGKLDIIIQLPYVVKSESKKLQAEKRREELEFQLKGSQYGIAYIDGTEKVTQLNRPSENNLLKQIEYLTDLLYDQLGITKTIMDGTADEKTMINYFNRTIEPIADAIVEAMTRSFVGLAGDRRGEKVTYFSQPFKLMPISELAAVTNSLSRNEILSSNEIRGLVGFRPSDNPKADQLLNSNMPQPVDANNSVA